MSKSKHFPHEIVNLEEEMNAKLIQEFPTRKAGFVKVGADQWFLPKEYQANALRYYNIRPRENDVWIVAFPCSYSTTNQEIVWLLANELNYEKASQIPLSTRFPYLEFGSIIGDDCLKNATNVLEFLENTTERRFIKTHLPFHLLPPNLLEVGCKVMYIVRDPKDVASSLYNMQNDKVKNFQEGFPKFWDFFENDMVIFSPYWSHVTQAWEQRSNNNLLFLFYEEQSTDPTGLIRKIARFLDVAYTDNEYAKLKDHLYIDNFKNNTNNFALLRDTRVAEKDESNDRAKDDLHCDLESRADRWIQENLKKTDFRFPNFYNN